MNQNLIEAPNNTVHPVTEIVVPFLEGTGLAKNSLYLSCLMQEAQMDALCVFQKETNKNCIDIILRNLSDNDQHIIELKDEYGLWCKKLHISHNLLHFLEFLASKDYNRIRNLLKEIHEHKFAKSYWTYYLGGALLTSAGAGLYFYLKPEHFEVVKQFLIEKLPEYGKILLDFAMSAEILSGIIIVFQFFQFLYENYIVLSNKTTSTQIKLAKLSKINTHYFLTITAQVFIFINSGISNTISNILFFLAAVFSLALTWLQFSHHKNPTSSDDNLKDKIHYLEALSYYERKKNQLNAEITALVPITIISVVGIILGPYYAFLTPIFATCQFLIAALKDEYLKRKSKFFAEELQNQISFLTKKEESIEEILQTPKYSSEEKIFKLKHRFNIFDAHQASGPMQTAPSI